MLLKVGRHLRPRPHFKMIIGREEGENRFLHGYRKQFTHLFSSSHNGPLVLIDGEVNQDDLVLAAQVAARFGQGRDAALVEVEVHGKDGASQTLRVIPLNSAEISQDWYL